MRDFSLYLTYQLPGLSPSPLCAFPFLSHRCLLAPGPALHSLAGACLQSLLLLRARESCSQTHPHQLLLFFPSVLSPPNPESIPSRISPSSAKLSCFRMSGHRRRSSNPLLSSALLLLRAVCQRGTMLGVHAHGGLHLPCHFPVSLGPSPSY